MVVLPLRGLPEGFLGTGPPRLVRAIAVVPGAAAVLVFVGQFFIIAYFAVDVPFSDEWEFFRPGALPDGLSLHWLLAAHNEHRIVPTKLLTWLLFRLNGLDFRVSILVSYALYGAVVLSVLLLLRRACPPDVFPYAVWFAGFAFSPINYENLSWGIQSVVHFYLLFFVAAVAFLFSRRQTRGDAAAGAAFAVLAVYSFASGAASVAVLALAYAAFKALRIASLPERRREEGPQLALVLAVILAAVGVWLATYDRVDAHGAPTPPTTAAFWKHYLTVLALGLGAGDHPAMGGVLLALAVVPAAALLFARRAEPGTWAVAVLATSLLATMAAISFGRGSFGVDSAKVSRYAEYGLALLLVAASGLAWVLRGTKVRFAALAALWLVCFRTFWNEWTIESYRREHARRMSGLACLREPRAAGEPVVCTDVYPVDFAEALRGARAVRASFTRTLR
jgi:hypothetical protein